VERASFSEPQFKCGCTLLPTKILPCVKYETIPLSLKMLIPEMEKSQIICFSQGCQVSRLKYELSSYVSHFNDKHIWPTKAMRSTNEIEIVF
jgi:hypothetical protein